MTAVLLCLLAAPPAAGRPSEDATAGPSPLPPPFVRADGVRTWADLPYRTVGGQTLALDLALPPVPEGPGAASPTPLVVCVHGGGWVAGGKGKYRPEIAAAAARGYAAATVQYRLTRAEPGGVSSSAFPAALHDVRAAVAFLVTRADELHLDPARVGLVGDSAGGHLCLLTALTAGDPPEPAEEGAEPDPPRVPVAAVVNLFGVTDMTAYYTGSRHARTILSLFLGGHLVSRPGAYAAASPVNFADAADPPVLTLHGTADPVVPFDQAERLHAVLEAAGVPNELVPVRGGTHGLFRNRAEVRRALYRFLDARLKPTAPKAAAAR